MTQFGNSRDTTAPCQPHREILGDLPQNQRRTSNSSDLLFAGNHNVILEHIHVSSSHLGHKSVNGGKKISTITVKYMHLY